MPFNAIRHYGAPALLSAFASVLVPTHPGDPVSPASPTSLVVLLVVDQMRPDYFDRFANQFTGGFARLRREGAFFTHGMQDHAITQTAPGHSTLLSGRPPASTGIITNDDGVGDALYPLIDTPGETGASPRNFNGTSLYDWMLAVDPDARALAVSRKDRGAILPVGRAKADVYWFAGGHFTTSRYYASALPDWIRAFNARGSVARLAGKRWDLLLPASAYPERDAMPWERTASTSPSPTSCRRPIPSPPGSRCFPGWIRSRWTSRSRACAAPGSAAATAPISSSSRCPPPTRWATTGDPTPASCTTISCVSTAGSAVFSTRLRRWCRTIGRCLRSRRTMGPTGARVQPRGASTARARASGWAPMSPAGAPASMRLSP